MIAARRITHELRVTTVKMKTSCITLCSTIAHRCSKCMYMYEWNAFSSLSICVYYRHIIAFHDCLKRSFYTNLCLYRSTICTKMRVRSIWYAVLRSLSKYARSFSESMLSVWHAYSAASRLVMRAFRSARSSLS